MTSLLAMLPPAQPILFIEFRFLWIFAIIFAVHWALRGNTARKVWLLVCSHAFYTCFFIGDPVAFFQNITAGRWEKIHDGWWFPLLLWGSTLMDYYVGVGIEDAKTQRGKKAWVLGSLLINLGVLGFFKYYGFFEQNVRGVFAYLGLEPSWEPLSIFLPYGISFYTFQSLSYSLEVYRGHLKAERNFINLAFFIAFFPQVVAGPIVRAMTFLPQTLKKVEWAKVDVRGALTLFFIGFVKKTCIGDGMLAGVADAYFAAPQDYNAASAWMAVLCFAGQIYCDFSGYTDMAIAIARLLGYELCQNFAFPYFAASITDFWRRWHMSLSSWLRDYLYISLGGNRGSKIFTYRNLMLTMVLGGLWHGAAWTFVVWGAMHGFALIVHREWARTGITLKWLAMPVTFLWVIFAWVPFHASDTYTGAMVKSGDTSVLAPFAANGIPAHNGKPIEARALRMAGTSFVVNGRDDANSVPFSALRKNIVTGDWHLAPTDGASTVAAIAAQPVVAKRVAGGFENTAKIWHSLALFKSHKKASVGSSGVWITLGALALMHWLCSRGTLAKWWRRIPDYCYAALMGLAVALALYMKPVVYKAFIYFQF